ncbi:membrane-spanning 4-domains subfamily A member 15-like [Thamnophis elegans]|uniref:membrane-spanning 4-domains subfamily A member 15-like n=1 Tax=Thamnophis elegans TaxID=35005 RepID=UPI0013779505|nr:membrane-spanning 4-domains subfamily A member 15-like [Thamnophis elegans]
MSKLFLVEDWGAPPSTSSRYVTFISPESLEFLFLSGRRILVVATLSRRMASGTAVVIPSNGENIIQTAPELSSVALQTSGATPYLHYGAQQIPTSSPQQVPQKGPLERFLKAEPKVLGAVQILIGVIHICFGAALVSSISSLHFSTHMFVVGGYPFWGGIFFISSGSLCVSAANRPIRGLVKSSVGMNITSAIISLLGIIQYLSNLIMYSYICRNNYPCSVGYGLSSVFFLFNLLEFCITVPLAHFGCQAACCIDDQPSVLFVPYQVIGGGTVAAETNPPPPPPPTYDNVVSKSQ